MVRRAARVGLALVGAAAVWLLWPERAPGPTGRWLARAGLAPRFETIDGVRIRYVRGGAGEPVLLLHGFASSIYTWSAVWSELARGHDLVALDLPGFGASDQPSDLSFSLYPRVVAGLLDRLHLERTALVGNSMGGALALLLAATQPERVTRLVLIDAAAFDRGPSDRPWLVRAAASRSGVALLGRLPLRRTLVRIGLGQVFFDRSLVTPEREDEYLAPLLRPGALESLASLAASPGGDAVARALPRVAAPSLIVWGAEDRWIPVEDAERLAAALRGSRKVVLPACGHLPQEERPAQLVRLLDGFLAPADGFRYAATP